MMKSALNFLNERLNNSVGEPASYCRGEISFDCIVVRASTASDQMGEDDGITVQNRLADILLCENEFDTENLIQPKKGDIITIDGDRFAVINRKPKGAWRWSDSHKTKYRIHVKDVKES